MKEYESIFVVRPSIAEDGLTQIVEKFKKIIEKNGGMVVKSEQWGKKRLAYEVKKEKKGFYNLIQLKGNGTVVTDLERNYMLDDSVIKYLTVCIEPSESKKPSESSEALSGAKEG